MRIFADGQFVEDDWRHLGDGEDPKTVDAERVIVPLALWRSDRDRLVQSGRKIGVRVEAGDTIDPASDALNQVTLFSVVFAKFSDGRGYSTGRVLRDRFGFAGELRAEGDVLIDQIPQMIRCGFTSFAVTHGGTIAALERGELPAVLHVYQGPNAGGPSWRHRFQAGEKTAEQTAGIKDVPA